MVQAVYTVQSHLNEAFPHISAANTYPGSSFRWSAKSSGCWWATSARCQDVDDADFEEMCTVLSIEVPVISTHSVFSVYQPDLPPPMLKPGHGIDAINEINDISEDVEEVVKVPTEAEFVHPPTSPQQVSSLSKSPHEQWCTCTTQCTHIPPKVYPRNSDWSFLLKSWKVKAWSGSMRLVW